MEKGIIKGGKKNPGYLGYSFEKKVKTLYYLRENGYNYPKTSKEMGITRQTIASWYADMHAVIYELIDRFHGNYKKVTKDMYDDVKVDRKRGQLYGNSDFDDLINDMKYQGLERLSYLLKKEKDTKKVADAINVLFNIKVKESSNLKNVPGGKYIEVLIKEWEKPDAN